MFFILANGVLVNLDQILFIRQQDARCFSTLAQAKEASENSGSLWCIHFAHGNILPISDSEYNQIKKCVCHAYPPDPAPDSSGTDSHRMSDTMRKLMAQDYD